MIVLGIDPGIERLGYGLVEYHGNSIKPVSYGLISTKKEDPKPERLYQIYNDLKLLVEKHSPDIIASETLIFAKNVKTALIISEVRGIIMLTAAQWEKPFYEFTPLEIKMSLTGYGRSSKTQIESAVQLILNLPEIPKPDDISDAIAIALCGGNAALFQSKIQGNTKLH